MDGRPGPRSEHGTDALVPVRGAELAVSRRGSGRPFIWTHGLVSSCAREDEMGLFPWGPEVLGGGVEVVRYDARGHGASSGTGEAAHYRWNELALDLLALADVLGIERFAAGGASMGVGASLHAAVLAPDRIERLVLVLVPAGWSDRPAQIAMYEKMAGIIETRGVERLVELMGDRPPYPFVARDRPDLTAIVHGHAMRWDPDVVPLALRGAAASDLPPPDRLAELDVPALVLTWAGDPGHPDTTAARLHEALPRSTLEIARDIRDVRRWPHLAERFLGER